MITNLLVLAATLLVGAKAPKEDAVKEELKKFQGKWKLVSAELEGKKPEEAERKTVHLIVEGNRFTLQYGKEIHKGVFTIDPRTTPKQINVEFTDGPIQGAKVPGIYQIDGDTRKSCFAAPEKDRPKDYQGGKDRWVWVWQADKP
jgi:uncharacterized protein (TIGR03067 family)